MTATRSIYRRWGKRALDLGVAVAALIALTPVLAAIAAIVLVAFGWPVLYAETRAGRGGVPFRLLKFRTMTDARDASGALRPDEERLTRCGRWLRRCSLDELLGLVHVIAGDMSLVGPRPLPVRYVERYTPAQARRLEVRPGITGLAQVRGRNTVAWQRRFALDRWYVDHYGPALDLKLMAMTVRVVMRREGVSHPGHATMHEFVGSAR